MPGQAVSERKLVTVLVVDTVGSTALAETMDPEEWTGIMFGAHERMKQAVHQFGGMVVQFTGDGLVALFGVPRTREEDAERAVQAALEMQRAMQTYEAELIAARRIPQFRVRIGLHSGMVVVGDVGNAQYSEFLAVGETVPLAQRVQAAGVPGSATVSEETAQLLHERFELQDAGEIQIEGRARPLRLWRVVRARAVGWSADRAESIPFVGRAQEMGILRGVVDQLKTGRGALVSISGEPGVGKSRLIAELRAYANSALPALHWFEAHGMPYGSGLYSLFQQVLRASLGITDQDSVENIRQRLRLGAQRQKFQDPELVVHMLELFLAIDEREKQDARFADLQGQALQRELFATVRHTKAALAQTRPTVFVLQDMHWADAPSVQLTLNDADLVRDLPILIIAAFRPDRDAPSWNYRQECAARFRDVYVELNLEPFAPGDAQTLLDALPGSADLAEPARQAVLRRAEGNPFFLEQVLRNLQETGAIGAQNGGTANAISEMPIIPNSVNVILTARLDRLGEPTRRVLQAAAVIGRGWTRELLNRVVMCAGWDDVAEALDLHLGVLERHQLVTTENVHSGKVLTFKHVLIQETAYNSILRKRRRELHRCVFQALINLYAGRLDEYAAELAYHAQAGQDWTNAYEYARRAGENAARMYARQEALTQYRRALDALERVQEPDAAKARSRAALESEMAALES